MKPNNISRGCLVLALASTVLLMASTAGGNMLPPLTTSDDPGLESRTRPQASPQPTRGLHINQELLRRSGDPTVASVAHYSYLGCFFDPAATRLLDGKIIWNQADNNPAACQSLCAADGLPDFFGVENTRNCLCGSTLAVSAAAAASLLSVTAAACSAACPGSAQALCGGYGYINMYAAATASAAVTVTVTQSPVYVDGWCGGLEHDGEHDLGVSDWVVGRAGSCEGRRRWRSEQRSGGWYRRRRGCRDGVVAGRGLRDPAAPKGSARYESGGVVINGYQHL